jgi:hypothetical protein
MYKYFIAGLTLTLSIQVFAAKEVGNGGNAILCPPNSGYPPARLYDHYEAEVKQSRVLDLGSPMLTVDQKLDLVFKRIDRLNPQRARLYRGWYADFWKDASLIGGIDLIPVPDTGVGYIPSGCELKQAALQQDPELPGDKRYTISRDIWTAMDADSQAGLILHELIYREATHQTVPHTNSMMVRYLNGYYSTVEINSATLKAYIQLLQLAQFENAEAQNGVPIVVSNGGSAKFYDDNTVSSATSQQGDFAYQWNGQTLKLTPYLQQTYDFIPSGALRTMTFTNSAIHLKLLATEHDIDVPYSLELDDQGHPIRLTGSGIHVALAGFHGTCSELNFNTSGSIAACTQAAGSIVLGSGAFKGTFNVQSGNLKFDSNGSVASFASNHFDLNTASFDGTCRSVSIDANTISCSRALGTWKDFNPALNIDDAKLSIDLLNFKVTLQDGFDAYLSTPEFQGLVKGASVTGSILKGSGCSGKGQLGGISFALASYNCITVQADWNGRHFLFAYTDHIKNYNLVYGIKATAPKFSNDCLRFTLDEQNGLKCEYAEGPSMEFPDGSAWRQTESYKVDITGQTVTKCGMMLEDCK